LTVVSTGKKRDGSPRQKPGTKLKTDTEKEEVKMLVARYDRRGFNLRQIADILRADHGYDFSRTTVCAKLQEGRAEYKEEMVGDRAALVAQKLAEYRELRREAWTAWERSKEDAERVTEEHAPTLLPGDEEGKPRKGKRGRFASATDPGTVEETLRRIKRIEVREGRLPANQYLNAILATLDAERELLGLDAPREIKGLVGHVHLGVPAGLPATASGGVDFDALAGRVPLDDPVEELIALPAHTPSPGDR
jgi:hypothetical protein